MLKVKVVESHGMLNIEEYVLTYPYNLSSNNDNDAHYNLNSFEYKNIKGSFRLMFCKKMDFSGFKFNGEKQDVKNGKITDIQNSHTEDSTATQVLLFTQILLFFVDEKHSSFSLNADKRILPHFLLINQDAKKNIQFFISYEGGQIEKSLKGEELIFYLNLYCEKDV